MAKLAADGPCFYSPLDVMAAKEVRDRILWSFGLNPDGTPTQRRVKKCEPQQT